MKGEKQWISRENFRKLRLLEPNQSLERNSHSNTCLKCH